jgi:putative tricarboxylic transport membrane protein
LFFGVGALALYLARNYPMGTAQAMGAGYFPRALAIILMGFGVACVALALSGRREGIAMPAWRPFAFVLLAPIVFGLLLRPAGLVIAIVAAVVIAGFAERPFDLRRTVLTAAGLSAMASVIFVYGLGQNIPLVGSILW